MGKMNINNNAVQRMYQKLGGQRKASSKRELTVNSE